DFDQALALRPNYPDVHGNRGNMYSAQKNWSEAVAAYNQALQLAPDKSSLHFNRGSAFMNQEQLDPAISDFSAYLTTTPNHAQSYYFRSLCHFRKGNMTAARQDAQTARGYGATIPPEYQAALGN
ncbi:MAG: tetratricopeptide repeat protein, partial [Bacteroidota bacterium]